MNNGVTERPELEQKLSELEILRQSLDEAKLKEKQMYDQLLRLGAEFENFRKRSEARIADARNAGREDVLIQVVGLFDALLHAEASCEKAKEVGPLKKGLHLLRQQFEKFLKDQGVVPIDTKGEKMNPHVHEAVAQVVNGEVEEGTILEEVQRGYKIFDRVLRPSRVSVATKPPDGASKQTS
ncbi:MAG: nucleotide exchange factor GrpE [Elusimicrobia bacterium]|nr:nucleotide exchange factor GrpE [Candidatus Obscuribacterium magneticum]